MWESGQVLGVHHGCHAFCCAPQLNEGATTIKSCLDVATSNTRQANPMVATNNNVHHVGEKSSSWGTPWSPSNVLPLHQNEGVTTIKSFATSNSKTMWTQILWLQQTPM